jgi:hypothetical protein
VHEGVIQIFGDDFFRSATSRAWISSSFSVLTKACLSECTSLTSVTFESNSKLPRIAEYEFASRGVKTFEIPGSVEVVYKSCFSECRSITSVRFESNLNLQRIEQSALAESGLKTIQVPTSVEVVCELCFYSCRSLTSITFEGPSDLREIRACCFEGSPRLHPIDFPSLLSKPSWKVISRISGARSSSIVDDDKSFADEDEPFADEEESFADEG